jgi:hypothetical protein
MDDGNSIETHGPIYAFKSSLMGAPFEFHLADEALEWRRGPQSGRTRYDRIRRVRLAFRPMTMQNHRFLTEIWATEGPKLQIASTSWKGLVEHERLDAAYRAFVTDLTRRIGAAGGETSFVTGSPAFLYWPGVVVFIGAAVALVGLIARALADQQWSGAAFIAAFLALFIWQAGGFFRRNKPGTFDPAAVPPQVLPRG